MRKSFLLMLAVSLVLGLSVFATQAVAADAKPLVVLSMSSYDALVANPDCVKDIGQAPGADVVREHVPIVFPRQAARRPGQDAALGAVLQIQDDKLSAYGFVPVTDAQQLAAELGQYIASTSDWGNGIYRVEGTEGNKVLYAKVTETGWILVSDSVNALSDAPDDPAKVLQGLNKQYDFALRLDISNIPAEHGGKVLETLKREADEKYGGQLAHSRENARSDPRRPGTPGPGHVRLGSPQVVRPASPFSILTPRRQPHGLHRPGVGDFFRGDECLGSLGNRRVVFGPHPIGQSHRRGDIAWLYKSFLSKGLYFPSLFSRGKTATRHTGCSQYGVARRRAVARPPGTAPSNRP